MASAQPGRRAVPQVVAHRGASHRLAEHTLRAYEKALTDGADALECDVRLTADGHLVCLHDRCIDRRNSLLFQNPRPGQHAIMRSSFTVRQMHVTNRSTRVRYLRDQRVGTISTALLNASPASVRRPRSNVANTPFRRCARASK